MGRVLRRVALVAGWASLVALASSSRPSPVPVGGAEVSDLPLVEVAPELAPDSVVDDAGRSAHVERATDVHDDLLVVFLTGDGGWAALDRHVAAVLAAHGVAVVGLDSRAYLSTPRTPEEEAADVARIARHYMPHWHRTRLALVGYSRGAEAAPFVAARLPDDLADRLTLVAMLAPSTMANFSFHWIDLVRDHRGPDDRPVVPEIDRLRGTPVLCVFGTGEKDSACPAVPAGLAHRVALKGGHHLGGDYRGLGVLILDALRDGRGTP